MNECNICGFIGEFESTIYHKHCNCPNCKTGLRHRLLVAALTILPEFNYAAVIENKKVLHFAPEQSIANLINGKALVYKQTDGEIDISDMNTIDNNSFDTLIACDVLEHVENDKMAFKEMYRVLSTGGYAILTVPQKDFAEKTLQDVRFNTDELRLANYGEISHLRLYGNDIIDMLQEVGFYVTAVNETFFEKQYVEKHILFPVEISTNPLSTNYRKIFFCKK